MFSWEFLRNFQEYLFFKTSANSCLFFGTVKICIIETSTSIWSQNVSKFQITDLNVIVSYFRSSHLRCSIKNGVLENLAKFTGKHLCQGLFLNKVAGLTPGTLFKKRLWRICFPVNFGKFLRTHLFYRAPPGDCFYYFRRYGKYPKYFHVPQWSADKKLKKEPQFSFL